MMQSARRMLLSAAVAVFLLQTAAVGEMSGRTAPGDQKPASSSQQAGSAAGTLSVGASTFRLTRAYAFPDKAHADASKETYRVFVTDRAIPAAALRLAVSAGANEEDRQQLAVELADQEIHGVEMIVGADKRVTRVNIYSPDSAMGLMLLTPGQFEAATFDAQRIAGKVFTATPINDARIGKTIRYEATFSAAIARAATK